MPPSLPPLFFFSPSKRFWPISQLTSIFQLKFTAQLPTKPEVCSYLAEDEMWNKESGKMGQKWDSCWPWIQAISGLRISRRPRETFRSLVWQQRGWQRRKTIGLPAYFLECQVTNMWQEPCRCPEHCHPGSPRGPWGQGNGQRQHLGLGFVAYVSC